MRLNKAQQKRIERAEQRAEWSCAQRSQQKQANVSINDKASHNGIRAVIWRG